MMNETLPSSRLAQSPRPMTPRPPATEAEWESYHDLRWRVLRAPWGQPRGGDADEDAFPCVHTMIADDAGRAIAVGRILFKSATEAQVRSMATEEAFRGRGLGRQVMEYLEQAARAEGITSIFLNAREDVVPFYAKLGYEVTGDGPTLFDCIRHKAMRKSL